MARLIDVDICIAKIKDLPVTYDSETVQRCIEMLSNAPAIDAEPVRHGKWIPCAKNGLILTEQMRREGTRWYGFKCSACNCVRKGNALREANYCPNCGCRMDENGR